MALPDSEAEARWRAERRRVIELYLKALKALFKDDERYRANLIKYQRWGEDQQIRWIDALEAQVRRGAHDGIAAAVVSMAVSIRLEE